MQRMSSICLSQLTYNVLFWFYFIAHFVNLYLFTFCVRIKIIMIITSLLHQSDTNINVNVIHISFANMWQMLNNKKNIIIVINYEVVYNIWIDINPFLQSRYTKAIFAQIIVEISASKKRPKVICHEPFERLSVRLSIIPSCSVRSVTNESRILDLYLLGHISSARFYRACRHAR